MNALLERVLSGTDLSEPEAHDLLVRLSREEVDPVLAGALLIALRAKGEAPDEVRGFATAMRGLARRPAIHGNDLVDVVGTGGDGSGSLNLSTGSALLAAACGARVVKHGNRSVSSRSGSADVLEAIGLALPLGEVEAGACLEATGFTFLFAPYYHPAMKALAPIRRALGVRTVFNLLGPLTNPAQPAYLLVGAWSRAAAELIAHTLAGLPIERAFVVHGAEGWDEATPVGPYLLFDVHRGAVLESQRDPASHGLQRCETTDLVGGTAEWNAVRLRLALGGERGAHRDALVLGAALTLELIGAASTPQEAAGTAAAAIDSGQASLLVDRVAAFHPARHKVLRAGHG